MVHTMGFPDSMMRRISVSESIPWLIQCRWITSAWLNSGSAEMFVPVLAMSTAKRLCFLNRFAFQMTMRSQMNCHTFHHDFFSCTTLIWSVCLSRTSILAFIPLFFRASIRRWAAMAAPPIRSDVLMISTLMCINVYAKVRFLEEMFGIFLPFYAPKSPFKVRLIRRMALAINELVRA